MKGNLIQLEKENEKIAARLKWYGLHRRTDKWEVDREVWDQAFRLPLEEIKKEL
jgi:hypothetical protein